MKYLTLAARLIIGSLFVYASVHKIIDPADLRCVHQELHDRSAVLEQYLGAYASLDRDRRRRLLDPRDSNETGCIAHHRNVGRFPRCSHLCLFHRFGHRLRLLFIGSRFNWKGGFVPSRSRHFTVSDFAVYCGHGQGRFQHLRFSTAGPFEARGHVGA